MKQLFSKLCLSSLIIPCTFFAMDPAKLDFDKEYGIPLETIHNNVTTISKIVPLQAPIIPTIAPLQIPTISQFLDEQFVAFEGKLLDEFGGLNGQPRKKKLDACLYFARVKTDVPEIIADPETIKKYSESEKTFFSNAINVLKKRSLDRYSNVTSDTLAIINNPIATQSCSILDNIPPVLKTFVMDYAYQNIDATPYKCLEFPQNCRNIDYHHTTHLAAITHNDTFQLWDLKTGENYIFPKRACMGWVRFSDNGEQLITALLQQKEPEVIHIDIWDSITKKLIYTIEHPQLIKDCILHNTPTKQILYIFDEDNKLFRYTIKKDSFPVLSEKVCTLIRDFYPHYSGRINYELSSGTLFKKCIPYFLCCKAIENTTNKNSLQKVRVAPLYEQLTPLEKDLIEKEIVQKAEKLMHNENGHNTRKSWFG